MNWLKRFTSSEGFRPRVRMVEVAGFGILLVGLYLIWQPLAWVLVGALVITYAQLMRR